MGREGGFLKKSFNWEIEVQGSILTISFSLSVISNNDNLIFK